MIRLFKLNQLRPRVRPHLAITRDTRFCDAIFFLKFFDGCEGEGAEVSRDTSIGIDSFIFGENPLNARDVGVRHP